MTFNVWGAEDTAAGRARLQEVLAGADADVIGFQELNSPAAAAQFAASLGYVSHALGPGGLYVLSRFPIVATSPANLGVQLELAPERRVWIFNAHLPAYPYQPYDLRDGLLPPSEAAVIAAAAAARGGALAAYLRDIEQTPTLGMPTFFTGDFNEPSHLDWTQAAADASPRPFDLKVEFPASRSVVDAGFVDGFRAVRPNVLTDPGATWTPGEPPPRIAANEVLDRIDFVYHRGPGVEPRAAYTLGYDVDDPHTDVAFAGYPSDHRAVVVRYALEDFCFVTADFNRDCRLDAEDWAILRVSLHTDLSGLTHAEAYALGDLTGDRAVRHDDFAQFKATYVRRHGAAAWAQLLAVPEPTAATSAALVGLVVGLRRQTRRRMRGGMSLRR